MVFLWNFLWSCTQLQTHPQPTNPETTNALAECKQGWDTLNPNYLFFVVCMFVCVCVFSGVRLLWSSPGISSDPVRDHCVCDSWTYSQWTKVPWTHCLGLLFSLLCGAFVLLFNSHTCCSQLLCLLCWRRGGITLVHWPVFRVRSSAHVQYWTLLPGEKQTHTERRHPSLHTVCERKRASSLQFHFDFLGFKVQILGWSISSSSRRFAKSQQSKLLPGACHTFCSISKLSVNTRIFVFSIPSKSGYRVFCFLGCFFCVN